MTSKLIIPRITGGLGNQLFTYAAARRLAILNNSELALDNISGFANDMEYQRHYQLDHFNIPCRKATAAERFEPFSRMRRYLVRLWNQRKPFMQRSYLVREGIDYDPRLLDLRPKGVLYLEGCWQSENYFIDIADILRQDLTIKAPIDSLNLALAKKIRNINSVAVHVRFFNESKISGIDNAPVDYYTRAIKLMEQLEPNSHYFIFSDQPDAAQNLIPLPNEQFTIVSHNKGDLNAYADFWLMTLCQHFIIANSTFSWWGAWLADSQNKKIIAPGFVKRDGISFWNVSGHLPGNWIKV